MLQNWLVSDMKSEFELFATFWVIFQFYYSFMCLPCNESVRLKEFSKICLHTTLSKKYYFIVLIGVTVLEMVHLLVLGVIEAGLRSTVE